MLLCVLGWTKLGTKQVTALFALTASIVDVGDVFHITANCSAFDFFIMERASGLESMKFLFGLIMKKRSAVCQTNGTPVFLYSAVGWFLVGEICSRNVCVVRFEIYSVLHLVMIKR